MSEGTGRASPSRASDLGEEGALGPGDRPEGRSSLGADLPEAQREPLALPTRPRSLWPDVEVVLPTGISKEETPQERGQVP